MVANTKIEWARHTWNPWWGCTKISTGAKGACEPCYAERMAARQGVKFGNHPRREASEKVWAAPFAWDKAAQRAGERPFVFCLSMGDIFDNQVDPAWRARAFQVMRDTPNLIYVLLTKRPQNVEKLSAEAGGLPPNAAVGATIVTQTEADRDGPVLARIKDTLRPLFIFVSAEPLMEEIDMTPWLGRVIDWVIAGGESGRGKKSVRPSHPHWFRSLRDQCADAGVAFFFKQWGQWRPVANDDEAPDMVMARNGHIDWDLPSEMEGGGERPRWCAMIYCEDKAAAGRKLLGLEHSELPRGYQQRKAAA